MNDPILYLSLISTSAQTNTAGIPEIYRGIWIALGITCVVLAIVGLSLYKISRNNKEK